MRNRSLCSRIVFSMLSVMIFAKCQFAGAEMLSFTGEKTQSEMGGNVGDLTISEPNNPNLYSMPPPFTSHEFLEKLVLLFKKTKGYVAHEDVEQMFGVKMNLVLDEGTAKNYRLTAGKDWFFDASVLETYKGFRGVKGVPADGSSGFVLYIDPYKFGDWKQGKCIIARDAIFQLSHSGWELKQQKVEAFVSADRAVDRFTMGQSTLKISHYKYFFSGYDEGATCVTLFNLYSFPA